MDSYVHFGREVCNDLDSVEQREWLISNNKGSFASCSLAGILLKRHHGLLFSPFATMERRLLMVKADIKVKIGDKSWFLYSNHWQNDAIGPRGFENLESFHLEGNIPVWHFLLDGIRLEMRLWMEADANATWLAISTTQKETPSIELLVNFFVNYRKEQDLMTVEGFESKIIRKLRHLKVQYNKKETLHIQLSQGKYELESAWVEDFYLNESFQQVDSGLDCHLNIGRAFLSLTPKTPWAAIRFADHDLQQINPGNSISKIKQADFNLMRSAKAVNKSVLPAWITQLVLFSQRFTIQQDIILKGKKTEVHAILAAYPQAAVQMRDTAIALSGLTLACGRPKICKNILEMTAHFIKAGLVPNSLPQMVGEELQYQAIDTSLWYILAWHQYIERSHDIESLTQVLPVLESIISAYHQGTHYGIKMDTDHLLCIENVATQTALTWMNAKAEEQLITPRYGKPVEVNALWYNALCIMSDFLGQLDKDQTAYMMLSEKVKTSFQRYINKDNGLYDILEGIEGDDATIRPNQIFALSLPYPLLETPDAIQVLKIVQTHLYTSYGLRTLSPTDVNYQGAYAGTADEKASQLHQGTIWTWLLGHYAMADYHVYQDSKQAKAILQPLATHVINAGVGSISAMFDGDFPHAPKGAPYHACAVATILEAWWKIQS